MRTANIALKLIGAVAATVLIGVGASGCGTTTVIHQTVIVTSPPGKATATTIAMPSPSPTVPPSPPGIWCLVQQGQMPLTANCEIYPSAPQLYSPPVGVTVLAGTPVGLQIGDGQPSTVTEHMTNPWAADVRCATSDFTTTGETQIIMVAHSSGVDFYSWGDIACGLPSAPDFGNEFFRKATITVSLSIKPLTNNLSYWDADLIQL